jgi:signal transduction histidine kinase/CheY-like chemotaxis protein/PAS domain-containing protein
MDTLLRFGGNLITSGLNDFSSIESRYKTICLNILLLIGITTCSIFATLDFIDRFIIISILNLSLSLLFTASFLYFRYTNNYTLVVNFGIFCLGSFATYLLATGGIQHTGHMWLYLFPVYSIFLMGSKRGTITNFIMLVLVTAIMLISGKASFIASYTNDFKLRFFSSFILVFLCSHLFGRISETVQSSLRQKNELLSRTVKELRKTEEELRQAHDKLELRVEQRTIELTSSNTLLSQEIEERKRAESALSESHATFATVLDSIGSDVYVVDQERCVVMMANRHLRDRLEKDIVGSSCWDTIKGRCEPCPDCRQTAPLLHNHAPGPVQVSEELDERTSSWYLQHARTIRWTDGRTVKLHVRTDITPLKQAQEESSRLESQLRQSQKLEAVGTLAGGIAHDFNNLLQGIQSYAEVLLLDKEQGTREYAKLMAIQQAAERGASLTRQLLTFSRSMESSFQPVDLNALINRSMDFLKRILPKMIQIEPVLDHELDRVSADASQIEQILLNLALNARDAMEEGGRLRILTRNVQLQGSFCRTHFGVERGEYVLLEVSDNGHGMDAEISEHVFEPFFTTKASGKGTGLGLAMVYGIVKNHLAHIECESHPGKGSSFRIYLPVTDDPTIKNESAKMEPVSRGTETVLLVDDEDFVRIVATEALQRFGYRVLCATTGEEALEIFEEEGDRIQLVILDLVMPGMGGKQCLLRLLEKKPEINIVIASGYSEEMASVDFVKMGARRFISKPYNIQQLLSGIREVLDRPQGVE